MSLPPLTLATIALGTLSLLLGLAYVDKLVPAERRGLYRVACVAALVVGSALGITRLVEDSGGAVDAVKGMIALAGAGAVFYEARREGARRPVAERWSRFVGIALGVAAILAYFNGLRFAHGRYYNRWDQYHYYMGARYFPELGYDGLYRCAAVAEDAIGRVEVTNADSGRRVTLDLGREVRDPDTKIRNLGGDNRLMPVGEVLAHPEACRQRFSAARWESFQRDVIFFRASSSKAYWEDMQKDHGFNPPPVWTVLGRAFASLAPASTGYLQLLASLDVLLLTGMFVGLGWAFGWRVFALGAVVWGCSAAAPFAWTGGSFLRQDWLFLLVMAVCLAKKRWFALAGAALAYATLLRVFPGLVGIGIAIVAIARLVRGRGLGRSVRASPSSLDRSVRASPSSLGLGRSIRRFAMGAVVATAVLVPVSVAVCGKDAYRGFYEHTLLVHDRTPLTNHMGLRVLISQATPFELDAIDLGPIGRLELPFSIGMGRESGRMKYTRDDSRTDPFEVWKDLRNERYARLRPVGWAIALLGIGWLALALRRKNSLWAAMCLAQVGVILMSQLTCYYYSFMILGAPLSCVRPLRRCVELSLLGFAILSQVAWHTFLWNDDKYWVLTLLSLSLTLVLLAAFTPRSTWEQIGRARALLTGRRRPSIPT